MRALFVSLALVSATAFAQFSPEVAVSTPVYGPAPASGTPVVATDGHDFLVAELGRTNPPTIYANRVTADGHVLDGTGIRIVQCNCFSLAVHFIDGAYVLLYSYTDPTGGLTEHTAMAVIRPDGTVIDGPRVIFDEGAIRSATNGSRIVIVTAHAFIAIDSRGNVIGRYDAVEPAYAIASNGTSFLAVGFKQNGSFWNEGFTALDANGKPVATSEIDNLPINALGSDPVIASDGSGYLVEFASYLGASSTTQRLDDHAAIQSSVDSTGGFPAVQLVWTGSAYVGTAWTGTDQKQTALVAYDRAGIPLAPPRILGDGSPAGGAAWNGSEALLTWSPQALAGVLTDATGTPIATIGAVAIAANTQRNVAIASSTGGDLVAWVEATGIFATRVTRAGIPLDGRGTTISTDTTDSDPGATSIRIVDDGTSFVLAWGGNRSWGNCYLLTAPVKVQRIAYSGELLGSAFTVSSCSRTFDLEMGADAPVLFFTPCTGEGVVAQRLSAGVPVGAATVVSNMPHADNPRAAWNGSEWLVAWNDLTASGLTICPPFFSGVVYAARVSRDLAVLDTQPTPIAGSVDSTDAQEPFVASNGRDFLVAYVWRPFGGSGAVGFRTVHADGSIDDPSFLAGPWFIDGLVWDGQRFGVAYTTDGRLFLNHVGSDDQVAVASGVLDGSVIAPHGGPLRVVYTRFAPEPAYGNVPRAFVRDAIPARRRAIAR